MSCCSYNSYFKEFIAVDDNLIFGVIDGSAHGITLTTAKEAWKSEISIMKNVISSLSNKDGEIIFEYDIPRLGRPSYNERVHRPVHG